MNYTKKIDYLMCKWLVPPRRNHHEFHLRNAFYNIKRATTLDEMRILSFKSAFSFLLENKIFEAIESLKPFDCVEAEDAYRIVEKTRDKTVDFDLFAYMMKSSVSKSYLVLAYNVLRVRNQEIPIIFRGDQLKRIVKWIVQGNYLRAKEMYQVCLDNSQRYLVTHTNQTPFDIVIKLKKIKQELKRLDVAEVWIYGSYARNEATPHSDLDMMVLSKRKRRTDAYVWGLQKTFEDALSMHVDMQVFLNEIDFSMFDKYMNDDKMRILNI